MIRQRCILLFASSAVALGLGAGCYAPDPAPAPPPPPQGVIFYANASQATQTQYGITRWHSIIQPSTGAVTIDGSDATGKVKFASVFRLQRSDNTYHIDSLVQGGSLTLDMATGAVTAVSIPQAEWAGYVRSFSSDWHVYHHTSEYSFWGYVGSGLAIVGGVAGTALAIATAPAWAIPAAVAVGVVAVAGGVATAIDSYQNDAAAAKSEAAAKAQNDRLDELTKQTADLKMAQQAIADQLAMKASAEADKAKADQAAADMAKANATAAADMAKADADAAAAKAEADQAKADADKAQADQDSLKAEAEQPDPMANEMDMDGDDPQGADLDAATPKSSGDPDDPKAHPIADLNSKDPAGTGSTPCAKSFGGDGDDPCADSVKVVAYAAAGACKRTVQGSTTHIVVCTHY